MHRARRRGTTWAIAASTIAHLAMLVVVLLQRPTLSMPEQERGPPEAIIPILIMPRTPPPAAGRPSPPAPIRLHRRPQRFVPPEVPTAPIAPPAPLPAPAPAAPSTAPPAFHPAPRPEGPKGDLRAALRQGAPGCANPDAVGLTQAERDLCSEKFGKGAKTAAFPGLGLNPAKEADLDSAAQHKEACRAYRASPNGAQPPLRGGSC
jgi:hypothetical protein